ncbi:MAG: Fic family protein [Bacteroidia bacterium]|nr:Fic family protein [Bacteroidia bacterium]
MQILPVSEIDVDPSKVQEVEQIMKSTFRLITFSRKHLADDLLNTYLASTTNLKELLSIKNAQMEAQNEQEAQDYVVTLNDTLLFVADEIKHHVDFRTELQLFQLFRSISPESHAIHPNRYRDKLVQIGSYVCPDPAKIPSLVAELFQNMNAIKNPIIKAIYFHHELIRIHPFIDGNGRTTRVAKNWILMYNLYPPIFIRDENEKSRYIETLSNSFALLEKNPAIWNDELSVFFNQEIERLRFNSLLVYEAVKELGEARN